MFLVHLEIILWNILYISRLNVLIILWKSSGIFWYILNSVCTSLTEGCLIISQYDNELSFSS